jgi:hypothetical protein
VADFVALAAVAERLIEENGRSVTITKLAKSPLDSTQPWRGVSVLERGSITGVTTASDRYAAASGLDVFASGNVITASGFSQTGNNGTKHVTAATTSYVQVSENLTDEPAPPVAAKLTLVNTSVTGIAVFVGSGDLGYRAIQEDAVKRGAEVCIFAANNDGGFALEEFDQITDGSAVWTILSAELLKPAGTRLLYIFEVKR